MDLPPRHSDHEAHAGCALRSRGDDCRFCGVRHLSICQALDINELDQLEQMASDSVFEERAVLFREEDEVSSVFNLSAGVARLIRSLPDGRRQVTGFALPGDFLGISLEKKWRFSAEAVTPLVACRFRRSNFEAFSEKNPHLIKKMHEFASQELNMAQDHMVLLGRLTAEEKLASFLVEMKKRWARVAGHEQGLIRLPMGRQDIADYLGLTIETVSRVINQMQRDRKLVIVPDGVRFVDQNYFDDLAL